MVIDVCTQLRFQVVGVKEHRDGGSREGSSVACWIHTPTWVAIMTLMPNGNKMSFFESSHGSSDVSCRENPEAKSKNTTMRKRRRPYGLALTALLIPPSQAFVYLTRSTREWTLHSRRTTTFDLSPNKVKEKDSVGVQLLDRKGGGTVSPLDSLMPLARNSTALEMAAMTAVGLGLSFGVIYALSTRNAEIPDIRALREDELDGVAKAVYSVVIPQDATDVISVALGEAIGGVIGAIGTIPVALLLGPSDDNARRNSRRNGFFTEAIADGDYFLTRAAALPLLEAVGLPSFLASLGSVLLASVPYEFVKFNSRQNEKLQKALLRSRQAKAKTDLGSNRNVTTWFSQKRQNDRSSTLQAAELDDSNDPLDLPEITSDITKWLEYDVLKTDFGGSIMWNEAKIGPAWESAAFGFLAALSSQLYLDIIYMYTENGPKAKRMETRSRSPIEWARLYTSRSLSAATLFAGYESAKTPVSSAIRGVLAGGVDGCLGSSDFQLCIATYMQDNPPEASPEAQIRSLVTAIVSLWNRIQTDGTYDTMQLARGLIVQFYNIASHLTIQHTSF